MKTAYQSILAFINLALFPLQIYWRMKEHKNSVKPVYCTTNKRISLGIK